MTIYELNTLDREQTLAVIYHLYQCLSDINTRDISTSQPTGWWARLTRALFVQNEDASIQANKLISTSPEDMKAIHRMRDNLYDEVSTGELGLKYYPAEPEISDQTMRAHLPYLDIVPDLLPFGYRFFYLSNARVRIDTEILDSAAIRELQRLIYAAYKHLSNLNKAESKGKPMHFEVASIVSTVRKQFYSDICQGQVQPVYYLGDNDFAKEAARHFPGTTIEVSEDMVPVYVFKPKRLE